MFYISLLHVYSIHVFLFTMLYDRQVNGEKRYLEFLSYVFFSDDVRDRGFTVILDMRGSTWQIVKPILKVLQVSQPGK